MLRFAKPSRTNTLVKESSGCWTILIGSFVFWTTTEESSANPTGTNCFLSNLQMLVLTLVRLILLWLSVLFTYCVLPTNMFPSCVLPNTLLPTVGVTLPYCLYYQLPCWCYLTPVLCTVTYCWCYLPYSMYYQLPCWCYLLLPTFTLHYPLLPTFTYHY